MVNPHAAFDSLYIAFELTAKLQHAAAADLHLFAYLACLLSLYHSQPVADWGYGFAGTRDGSPFNPEIESAVRALSSIGHLRVSDSGVELTAAGREELRALQQLSQNQVRVPYLEPACSSSLAMPVGVIYHAVAQEPTLRPATRLAATRPLLDGPYLSLLYEQFAASGAPWVSNKRTSCYLRQSGSAIFGAHRKCRTKPSDKAWRIRRTMTLDDQAMAAVFEDAFVPFVLQHHGAVAGPAVRSILHFLKGFYQHFAVDGHNDKIIVFQALDGDTGSFSNSGLECTSLSEIVNKVTGPSTIQLLSNGAFALWANCAADPVQLSLSAVVYSFHQGAEYFHANKQSKLVVKLIPGRSSNFALPTFSHLRDALAAYRDNIVRTSSCEILNSAWYEPSRLFFKAGPEETIRRSLTGFLKITFIGGAEVRPEQVVDESHPVDIKVTWFMTNRLALIEIKWLGRSRDDSKIKRYTPTRAQGQGRNS